MRDKTQTTTEKTDEEIEKLVELEDKFKKEIDQSDVKRTDNRSSIQTRSNEWYQNKTSDVTGKITDIRTTGKKQIELEISHPTDVFTETMEIPKNIQSPSDSKLSRLLKYKNIRNNRFLELRGEDVPVIANTPRPHILVPEKKNIVSRGLFSVFQKSRKYNFVRYSYLRKRYELTMVGLYIANIVSAPLLLGAGSLSGYMSVLLTSVPLLSLLSVPLGVASALLMFVGFFLSFIAFFTTIMMIGGLMLMFVIKTYGGFKSKFWPL